MTLSPALSILIVHYRTPEPLHACLTSLFAQSLHNFEVIIIDNENNPILPELLSPWQNRIQLVQNIENVGFGRANNQAFALSQAPLILLLNPDTLLPEQDSLEKLMTYQKKHPEHGLIGVKINDHKAGTIKPNFYYPGLKKERYQHYYDALPGDISWVLGAAMLIPRAIYTATGGFDPDFFLYGEEADLCLRIRKAGYSIGYTDTVSLEHLGGASEANISEYEYWTKKQRGLYLFYSKHYPKSLSKKLIQRESRRAFFRLLTLKLQMMFSNKNKYLKKQERNQAIYDCTQHALALWPRKYISLACRLNLG